MPDQPSFSIATPEPVEGKIGATAAFPYDRMTVERFRSAFPDARWRDDLRVWFVLGTTAERRLNLADNSAVVLHPPLGEVVDADNEGR